MGLEPGTWVTYIHPISMQVQHRLAQAGFGSYIFN